MTAQVDAYIAALPHDQRMALTDLRALLRSILPDHVETISYAMPGLRAPGPHGRMVAGYAAFRHHLGLYPHSGSVMAHLTAETAGFKTSKSGILFTPATPLPDPLIRRIIALRQAELAAGYGSDHRAGKT